MVGVEKPTYLMVALCIKLDGAGVQDREDICWAFVDEFFEYGVFGKSANRSLVLTDDLTTNLRNKAINS